MLLSPFLFDFFTVVVGLKFSSKSIAQSVNITLYIKHGHKLESILINEIRPEKHQKLNVSAYELVVVCGRLLPSLRVSTEIRPFYRPNQLTQHSIHTMQTNESLVSYGAIDFKH